MKSTQKGESQKFAPSGSRKSGTAKNPNGESSSQGDEGVNGASGKKQTPPDEEPQGETRLLPHHRAMLEASAISSQVINARGYRTATKKAELKELGFSDTQCRVPALVIPVFDVTGAVALHQIRPDMPRAGQNGKPIKYDTPRNAKMALDIPPAARPFLGNPNRPLFITEGVKKADSAVSHNLCCVALLGVWNFRGMNDDGGKTVLAAWESIALEDREVYIVFDSDVALKPEVYKALLRLKVFLESRKALVRVIYLDPKSDGSKVGLDDFFAAGGVVATLLAQGTDKLRKGPEPEHDFPYRETPLGLLWKKPTREGTVDVPLCNFTARIVTECEEDDGVETQRTFDIAVTQGERVATVRIPWEKFNAVNWPIEALGADAAIVPGPMARDHIRFATQLFSKGVPRQKLYTHLGWRKIGEQWLYLHAGGAIGAEGTVSGIEVATPAALDRFLLPDPPEGDTLKAAIRASLSMLAVAPHTITFPLLAAVYRAVLGDTDLSIHLAGPTGVGKSELAALAQQHHGPELDARHLPASWTSTGNSLEGLAFTAKDSLLVIDDFAPTGSTADVQRLHRDADRVFRSQGNRAGKLRMRADTTLRPAKPPRGMVLSTGEDIPRGQSLRARILTMEPSPSDVDWTVLSQCQKHATEGLYAQSLAGFLRWLTPQYERIKKGLRREVEDLRAEAVQGSHKRTPEIAANLALGFRFFLKFAREAEAISAEEDDSLWQTCWNSLSEAASAQARHQGENEAARRFIELISASISSGKAHLASPNGGSPNEAEAWGWRFDGGEVGWVSKGNRSGWLDGENVYLQPDSSYSCVQDLARSQGDSIAVSVQTLRRRLKEKGFLASWDEVRETATVRRILEGKQQAVLHLRKSIFSEALYPYKKPDKPDIDPEQSGNGSETGGNTEMSGFSKEAKPDKPDIEPTLENQAKSNTNGTNVGFVGLNIGREGLPQETKTRGLFEGKTDVGFVGFPENQNPTSGIENPTFAPEASETEDGEEAEWLG
jgi:hypothetical protein